MPFRGTLVDFTPPVGGMFLWLKPRLPKAMLTLEEGTLPSQSAMEDIFDLLLEKNVVVVPGDFFDTDNYNGKSKENKGAPYLRICYTFDDVNNVIEGTRRLVDALSSIGCGN
ncbi:hypothetical protein DSO57_1033378 [Entomophthora muscae]|nr:hypothetical protein DSO57_1033378 [Entomophthora muscae]